MTSLTNPTRRIVLSALPGAAATVPAVPLIVLSGGQAPAQTATPTRQMIAVALTDQGLLTDGRRLAHLSHFCDFAIDREIIHVVDVRELIPGATTPRGHNRIVMIDTDLSIVREIEYGASRPLFCSGRDLHFDGDVIGPDGGEGNVLSFSDDGATVTARFVEANDLPAPQVVSGETPAFQ